MYIIDKNQDYYDYLSHIYGVDKHTIYDRRGSKILSDEDLCKMTGQGSLHYIYNRRLLLLEVGFTQYLIRVTDEKTRAVSPGFTVFESCNFEILHMYNDFKNHYDQPLSIRTCNVRHSWGVKAPMITGSYEQDILKAGTIAVNYPEAYNTPILKDTSLTSLIPNEVIWKELQNYISSLRNDKDIDIMTNVEKIENYGFNKKISFRNPIK